MLDIDMQKHLDQAGPLLRRRRTGLTLRQQALAMIGVALLSAAGGIFTYRAISTPVAMPADDLGKLAVIVSEQTNTVPADLWIAMERKVGRSASQFDGADQISAIAFLLELLEKKPKETVNIW